MPIGMGEEPDIYKIFCIALIYSGLFCGSLFTIFHQSQGSKTMKKLIPTLLLVASVSAFGATEKAQKEIAEAIATGEYQKLRNVAYSMESGTFGHDENPLAACALRRVILLVNSSQVDVTDYNNEAIACRKIQVTDNQQAWETAFSIAKAISAKKK